LPGVKVMQVADAVDVDVDVGEREVEVGGAMIDD
jgi:hypothetical protein